MKNKLMYLWTYPAEMACAGFILFLLSELFLIFSLPFSIPMILGVLMFVTGVSTYAYREVAEEKRIREERRRRDAKYSRVQDM